MATVRIRRGDGDGVEIEVLGREFPNSSDYWDGNWVRARVTVSFAPWRGTYVANLRTTEFAAFRAQIEDLYRFASGRATFEPMEPWLALTLEMDKMGRIALRGEAKPEGWGHIFGEVGLTFALDQFFDQTYLRAVIAELREIEAKFPIRR